MLYSTNTQPLSARESIGLLKGVEMIADSGFTAVDLSFNNDYEFAMASNYKDTARKLNSIVNARGVIFNQAHAPFGGGYEKYTTLTIPNLPRVIEFCGLLGIKCLVVHPLQRGRYYGQEEELFELNMKFYSSLAPYAKDAGVKIGIENMWHNHPVTGVIVDDTCADPHELNRYYDSLNDPEAFTVCLDLGHVALCNREPEDAVRVIGHTRLGAIHAHDVDYVNDLHTLPGQSKINWEAVCRALAEVDYTGDFTLEANSFIKRYPEEHFPATLRFMAETAKLYADKIEAYKRELNVNK